MFAPRMSYRGTISGSMMTQVPQQPPVEPEGEDARVQPPAPPIGQPQQPPYVPYVPPQWGQSGQAPQYSQTQPPAPQSPQQPPYVQPQQPQWGQYAQPGQQYGQPYAQPGFTNPGFNNYVSPPKPGVIPLRPLGLGEILDGAFQAARRNGKAMFGSALIFQLATTAVTLLVMYLAFGQAFGDLLTLDPNVTPDSAALESMSGGLVSFSVSLLLTSILAVVIQMILQGTLVIPVLRAVLNRKTTFTQMWRLVRPRIVSLLLLALYMPVPSSSPWVSTSSLWWPWLWAWMRSQAAEMLSAPSPFPC